MEINSQYLDKNRDFLKFVEEVSDNTGVRNNDKWLNNARENRTLFKKCGWATVNLQDKGVGKTAIIIGASPALSLQLDTLKEIQNDNNFILCGLSCNLEYLLNNGIQPKYVITVDADKSQGDFWKNLDMEKTRDITLIASTQAYPEMLKKWKGPLRFISLGTADKKLKYKIGKWYSPINGNRQEFPSLMSQFNIMTAFVFTVLGCNVILFVGNELSFKDDNSTYYVDQKSEKDEEKRWPFGDIYGNLVYTTTGLFALKLSLESFLEIISGAGWFINCTEAGIFGISKRYKDFQLPWIHQLTLKDGINQARCIMTTGQPIYKGV
jgi:hypothetical protein